MYRTYYLVMADKHQIDVTHILESDFKSEEILWWLMMVGRWYQGQKFMLLEKIFCDKSDRTPVQTFIIRRFDLTKDADKQNARHGR